MGKAVVGDFDTYAQAAEVVRDLELQGITGAEVEVVSGADDDVRGVGASSSSPHGAGERIAERIGHFFRSLSANEVQKGRAMVIVRVSDDRNADRVAAVLRQRGGEIRRPES